MFFSGIGYAIVVVMVLVNIYYNVLNAYALYFLFASITDKLPWATCGHEWNTKYCVQTVISKITTTSVNDSVLMCNRNRTLQMYAALL